MERLNTNYLFEKMFNEDPEGNKLSFLPGIIKEIEVFLLSCFSLKIICNILFFCQQNDNSGENKHDKYL